MANKRGKKEEEEELSEEESGWMHGEWYYVAEDEFAKWDRDYQSQYTRPTAAQEAAEEAKYAWENLSVTSVKEGLTSVASITAKETAARVSPVVSEYANTVKVYASAAAREASARLQPAFAEYAQTARNCASQATRAVLSRIRPSQSQSQHIPDLEHVQSDWERPFSSPNPQQKQHQDGTEGRRASDDIYITQEQTSQAIDQGRLDYDPLGVSEEYHRSAQEGYVEMRRKRLQDHWEQKKEHNSRKGKSYERRTLQRDASN